MQRGGSWHSARRWSLLRQRKHRSRKRLKKASRSGLGRREPRATAGAGAGCRGMGSCRAERGEEPRLRSRMEATKVQGFPEGEIALDFVEGGEPTTTDLRRERAADRRAEQGSAGSALTAWGRGEGERPGDRASKEPEGGDEPADLATSFSEGAEHGEVEEQALEQGAMEDGRGVRSGARRGRGGRLGRSGRRRRQGGLSRA